MGGKWKPGQKARGWKPERFKTRGWKPRNPQPCRPRKERDCDETRFDGDTGGRDSGLHV